MYKRTRKEERSRRRIFLLAGGGLLALAGLALLMVFAPWRGEAPLELSYSQLIAALDEGRVISVTFVGGERIDGRMRAEGLSGEAAPFEFRTLLPVPQSDHLIQRFEAAQVPIDARATERSLFGRAGVVALWLLIAGVAALFLWKGPGARFVQHSKTKSRIARQGRGTVSFADVAGADEAKSDLEEIVEFLRDPQRFTRLGGRMPRGALLAGEPGNGKTLLARAVAGEAGCEFFSTSGSDFVEMFVGTGAARVRDLFRQARTHAPAIVFIDEIDAVGRRRGEAANVGSQDEREQALNQLLVEMDGFKPSDSVVVLAATNRPDVLDPALLRRGRFDRRVTVGFPDVRGREGILEVHAKGLPLAPDVSLEAMARGTGGMSGADLASIVNEAALAASRRGSGSVEMADLEEARDRVLMGSERRSLVLTNADRRLTAYHEAGHAVAGLMLSGLDPVHKVTIIPRERSLGVTASLPERDRHTHAFSELRARLIMLMAGRAAEEHVLGAEHVTTGAGGDIQHATRIARRMVVRYGMSKRLGMVDLSAEEDPLAADTARLVDEEIRRIIDEAYREALELLKEHRDLLDGIAAALLEKEVLGRDELWEIVEERSPASEPVGSSSAPRAEPASPSP
jgi:cell division protease FtsH